jgi:hypothetical protein
LNKLDVIAAGLKPTGMADGARQAMLSLSLMRLSDARQERLMAADCQTPSWNENMKCFWDLAINSENISRRHSHY